MKALLEIDGWRKYMDIPSWHLNRGYTEIALYPPLSNILLEDELITEEMKASTRTVLVHKGYLYRGKFPIFKLEGEG